jgi:hypothetical protein
MPDPEKKPHQEADRLSRSVKRRRLYAESLRGTAGEIRATEHDDDAFRSRELLFAERLGTLAEDELHLAREEEARAKELRARKAPPFCFPRNPHAEEQARAAIALLDQSGSRARVRHLAVHYGIDPATVAGPLHDPLLAIEKRQGTDEATIGRGIRRMPVGARIDLAETNAFGAPRF